MPSRIEEIPETHRQYMDGAITVEELFNKLLLIMTDNVDLLKKEITRTNPTVSILEKILKGK